MRVNEFTFKNVFSLPDMKLEQLISLLSMTVHTTFKIKIIKITISSIIYKKNEFIIFWINDWYSYMKIHGSMLAVIQGSIIPELHNQDTGV